MAKYRPSHRAEDIAAGKAKHYGTSGGASIACERCGTSVGHHENLQTHLEDEHLPSVPPVTNWDDSGKGYEF